MGILNNRGDLMNVKLIFMIARYVLIAVSGFLTYNEQAKIEDFTLQSMYTTIALGLLLVCALLGTPVIGKRKEHDAKDHLIYLIVTGVVFIVNLVGGILIK